MDSARKQEFFACLGLKHTPGLGPVTLAKLLRAYPTAVEAVRDARQWPERKLTGTKPAKACAAGVWREAAEAEYRAALSWNMDVLLFADALYPPRLKAIPDPPLLLYATGDLGLLANPALAVVGARECSGRGLAATRDICAGMSAMGLTIVSGLALGIDRQAHQGGLDGLGSSIAVLGCGLDRNYPAANRDLRRALEARGLVLTEYAPGTQPQATHFPHRNRIISGLSLGVLVVEAALKSGSLITARLAGEQGRDVFVLAGPHNGGAGTGAQVCARASGIVAPDRDLHSPDRGLGNPDAGHAVSHQVAPDANPLDPRARPTRNQAAPHPDGPYPDGPYPDGMEWDESKYEGCQKLLDDGAMLVSRAEEVLAELSGPLREALRQALHKDEEGGAALAVDPTLPPEQIPLPVGMLDRRTRDPLALPDDPAGGPDQDKMRPRGALVGDKAVGMRGGAHKRKGSGNQDNPVDQAAPRDQAAPVSPIPDDLPDDEAALLDRLAPGRRPHMDELVRALGWDVARASAALLSLELRGLVRQLPGLRYERS